MYFRADGFELIRPDSIDDAISMHGDSDRAAYLAGGTAILSSRYARGGDFPDTLISLNKIDGLSGIRAEAGSLSIGSLTALTDLERNPTLQRSYPGLREAIAAAGSWQVRTRATVGGNIANASPTADLGPSLLTLGSRVRYRDEKGDHVVGLDTVWKAPGELKLRRSAVITAIELRPPDSVVGSAYQRLALRHAMDTAMAGVSAVVAIDDAGQVTDARIAIGGVVGVPIRVTKAEQALLGTSGRDEDALSVVAGIIRDEAASPKHLVTRSSPTIAGYLRRAKRGGKDKGSEYRIRVIPVLAVRAIRKAVERAQANLQGGASV